LRKKKSNQDDRDLENDSFNALDMGLFLYMANPWDGMI